MSQNLLVRKNNFDYSKRRTITRLEVEPYLNFNLYYFDHFVQGDRGPVRRCQKTTTRLNLNFEGFLSFSLYKIDMMEFTAANGKTFGDLRNLDDSLTKKGSYITRKTPVEYECECVLNKNEDLIVDGKFDIIHCGNIDVISQPYFNIQITVVYKEF